MDNELKITCPKCREKITITVKMTMFGGGSSGGVTSYEPPTETYELLPKSKDQEHG